MLYWIWLAGLMMVALGLVVKGFRFVDKTSRNPTCEGPGYLMVAVIVAVVAIALTHPVHLGPIHNALSAALPDHGTYIHELTLWIILVITALGLIITPLLITYSLHPKRLRTEMIRRLLSTNESTHKPGEPSNAVE